VCEWFDIFLNTVFILVRRFECANDADVGDCRLHDRREWLRESCFGNFVGCDLILGLILVSASLALQNFQFPNKRLKPPAEIVVVRDNVSTDLTGILMKKQVFGPPGYGENPDSDGRRPIYVLATREKVTFANDPTISTQNLQLFFSYDDGPASRKTADGLVKRCVDVSGAATQAEVGAEYTPIVIQVESIHRSSTLTCKGIKPTTDGIANLVP
jgi:hypothetical protein